MKRLDIDGLKYYTSKLLGKIKSWFVGFTPTVHVRPANNMYPQSVEGITLGLGKDRIGPDIQSDITASIFSDQLAFIVHCDSVESAEHICNSGEYVLRFSYLSRRYDTPKWVCPSRNKDASTNGRWFVGTTWEEVPIDSSCFYGRKYITIPTGNSARDMVLDIIDKGGAPDQICNNLSSDQRNNVVYPFLLENAILFGSNNWEVRSSKVIKKKAMFKGVLEYLNDTEQAVNKQTLTLAPSNAYSIPVKVSVWKGDLELPGGSIGVLSFHKRRGSDDLQFFYKYKETNKR